MEEQEQTSTLICAVCKTKGPQFKGHPKEAARQNGWRLVEGHVNEGSAYYDADSVMKLTVCPNCKVPGEPDSETN